MARVKWKDLLASKDLSSALPLVLQTLDLELSARLSGSATSLASLAQAVATTLSQSQVSNPSRSLLAASALLAALDLQFPKDVEVALVNDSVVKGVVASSASSWPLVSAVCIRALCSLVLASQKHQVSKEERVEKQGWTRKVVPHIKAALEAHPKSFHVQEAVAEGSCALLMDGNSFGGQVASLWPLLWPLAVHPKKQIAEPSSLALCRMTWLARGTDAELPTAEKAIHLACDELSQLFDQSIRPNLNGAPAAGAILQSVRLVDFLKILLLHTRSKPADLPPRRDRKGADVDDALVLLPLPKIMGTIDLLLGSLLRETSIASKIISNDAVQSELLTLLNAALELASAAVDVSGASLLVFSAQVRRWLEMLADQSPKTDGKHCIGVFKLIRRLESNSPAILLRQPLLSRLCQYALDAMHHEAGIPLHKEEHLVRLPVSRKRKADVLKENEANAGAPSKVFSSACHTLTRIIDSGAPMLPQPVIGSICEQLVQTIWHGLLRSAGTLSGKEVDKCLVYRRVCRDPESVLGLLNVMRVLHQPRQGAVRLAPSLTHAFAALVSVLQDAFERHAPGTDSDSTDCIRLRLREMSDSLRFDRFGSQKVSEGVGIVWPEVGAASPSHAHSIATPASERLCEDAEAPNVGPVGTKQHREGGMPSTKDHKMEVDQPVTEPVADQEVVFMECEPDGPTDSPSSTLKREEAGRTSASTKEASLEVPPEMPEVVETVPAEAPEVVETAVLTAPAPTAEEFFTPRNASGEAEVAEAEVALPELAQEAPPQPAEEPKAAMELFSRRCLACTAALGQGVANTVESSEPQLIKALDQVLGLDHPTDATKKEVQKFVNQNAKAAAGNFASVVGNFSKVLSRGERDVGSNVSTVLAAMGEALENEKPEQPAPGQFFFHKWAQHSLQNQLHQCRTRKIDALTGAAPGTAAGTDLNDAASSAMKDVSTMIRSGEKAVSKMLKKQESSQGCRGSLIRSHSATKCGGWHRFAAEV
eukprot:g19724.t2